MHATPKIRGGVGTRLAVLVGGLFVFAAGIVALLESRLGLSPWDVLHQGLARETALSFGAANIVVSVVILAVAWQLGARVGVGTLANAVLVGAFVEVLGSLAPIAALGDTSLAIRVGLLCTGIVLMGVGTALYIGADFGAGPRDSLMVVGARRTRFRLGAVRGALEVLALTAGWALGGTVGVGTVAFAIAIGPMVELSLWLLRLSGIAHAEDRGDSAKHDDRHIRRPCGREAWDRP